MAIALQFSLPFEISVDIEYGCNCYKEQKKVLFSFSSKPKNHIAVQSHCDSLKRYTVLALTNQSTFFKACCEKVYCQLICNIFRLFFNCIVYFVKGRS